MLDIPPNTSSTYDTKSNLIEFVQQHPELEFVFFLMAIVISTNIHNKTVYVTETVQSLPLLFHNVPFDWYYFQLALKNISILSSVGVIHGARGTAIQLMRRYGLYTTKELQYIAEPEIFVI